MAGNGVGSNRYEDPSTKLRRYEASISKLKDKEDELQKEIDDLEDALKKASFFSKSGIKKKIKDKEWEKVTVASQIKDFETSLTNIKEQQAAINRSAARTRNKPNTREANARRLKEIQEKCKEAKERYSEACGVSFIRSGRGGSRKKSKGLKKRSTRRK